MATKWVSMMQSGVRPDTSGNIWQEPYSNLASNDNFDVMIWRFGLSNSAQPTTRIGLFGHFIVPPNYFDNPVIIPVWTATGASGNCVWDLDYRAVGGNDAESMDQATNQESLSLTDAAPSVAHRRLYPDTMAATAGNFAAGDSVLWKLFRDGTDAADTMALSAILFDLLFQYNDA